MSLMNPKTAKEALRLAKILLFSALGLIGASFLLYFAFHQIGKIGFGIMLFLGLCGIIFAASEDRCEYKDSPRIDE